jgi:hypothetical protein
MVLAEHPYFTAAISSDTMPLGVAASSATCSRVNAGFRGTHLLYARFCEITRVRRFFSEKTHDNEGMSPNDAKRLVLEREERMPINRQWIAARIGKPAQSITQWLTGTEPRDPHIWVMIAKALGLACEVDPRIGIVREIALYILEHADDADIRAKAAELLRQFSEKTR